MTDGSAAQAADQVSDRGRPGRGDDRALGLREARSGRGWVGQRTQRHTVQDGADRAQRESSNATGPPPTVVTSNREPIEWLAQMADALLAPSAIDRPVRRLRTPPRRRVLRAPPKTRNPHRHHQPQASPSTPHLTDQAPDRHHHHTDAATPPRRSHHTGETKVESSWRATPIWLTSLRPVECIPTRRSRPK